MNREQEELAKRIKKHLQEVSASLDGEFIVIGGWAVYAWKQVDMSLDGDAMVSFEALGILRDEYFVTPNPRMKKHQYTSEGYDVDLYVEQQHGLPVPFDELRAKAVQRDGMWVACPEHLLAMKIAAFKSRKATPKGEKDKKDIITLIQVIKEKGADVEVMQKYVGEEEVDVIETALSDKAIFMEICSNNAHEAKYLAQEIKAMWDEIYEICRIRKL